MRLLADENFPRAAVDALRASQRDVAWVRADGGGSVDGDVLRRIADASAGIVLFRVSLVAPDALARLIVVALRSRGDWVGHFSVVEPKRVRMRRLA